MAVMNSCALFADCVAQDEYGMLRGAFAAFFNKRGGNT